MNARVRFLAAVKAKLDYPVVWAAKGPDAFDCSGLVTACLLEVGGRDLRHIDNAQALHDKTRELGMGPTEKPLPADLVFYGIQQKMQDMSELKVSIIHVAIVDEFGGVISADGATSRITSLKQAMANPANRVRRHPLIRYRTDTPFVVTHRFTLLDELDGVSR
jgi:cell wall-associated NlpC family hydrolase